MLPANAYCIRQLPRTRARAHRHGGGSGIAVLTHESACRRPNAKTPCARKCTVSDRAHGRKERAAHADEGLSGERGHATFPTRGAPPRAGPCVKSITQKKHSNLLKLFTLPASPKTTWLRVVLALGDVHICTCTCTYMYISRHTWHFNVNSAKTFGIH